MFSIVCTFPPNDWDRLIAADPGVHAAVAVPTGRACPESELLGVDRKLLLLPAGEAVVKLVRVAVDSFCWRHVGGR